MENEQSDDQSGTGPARDGESAAERWSDHALRSRMRLGEVEAFREFFARFEPMLRELAERERTRDVDGTVLDVLDDVAERIRNHRVPRKLSLAAYLAAALRNRIRGERRLQLRRASIEAGIASSLQGGRERAVLSLCSAYTLRAASPQEPSEEDREQVERDFHEFLDGLLSVEERQLLGWLGDRVPQREIAEWTNAPHGVVRMRIHRLRARIAKAIRAYLARLDAADRARLERSTGGMLRLSAPVAAGDRRRKS